MSSDEVSMEGKFFTSNHGGEDVTQLNEKGGQDILEAVEEPPAKRSKIDKIPKTVVLEVLDRLREADNQMISTVKEALKNFEYGYHQIRKNCVEEAIKKIEEAAEETLQMKDDEINLLRKKLANYRLRITDYARERREMLKYIDEAESVIKTTESYQTSVIMVLRKFLLREYIWMKKSMNWRRNLKWMTKILSLMSATPHHHMTI